MPLTREQLITMENLTGRQYYLNGRARPIDRPRPWAESQRLDIESHTRDLRSREVLGSGIRSVRLQQLLREISV